MTQLFENLWWITKSVVYEEFLFRGVLLLLSLHYLSPRNACLLNGFAFGIYHWFSYGIIGNIQAMIYILILTGSMGYLLAHAFHRSKGIIAPIGIHMGVNISTITLFSKGPIGSGVFLLSDPATPLNLTMSLSLSLAFPLFYMVAAFYLINKIYSKE
ncbi:CPBP family intramembrane metalloprotease [Temperatibacter marinus]|uniref:CPBP family intramembrane metalloprotease n=1 Tax=Temperatibacter marinus TaxID=1456591 RepID=A0AA52EHJ1_9PROT|nr:CPBP family intramembrane glutamic endopeptidase [Temperatibacter marinus]WND02429.1 CPBP family intramembrane metalloprotease [Temperatibacter marinus]